MEKELSPLEALQDIKQCLFWSEKGIKEIDIIEKELKALDTLKQIFQFEVYEYEGSYYIRGSGSLSQIRKDAFDLLKEVLK